MKKCVKWPGLLWGCILQGVSSAEQYQFHIQQKLFQLKWRRHLSIFLVTSRSLFLPSLALPVLHRDIHRRNIPPSSLLS